MNSSPTMSGIIDLSEEEYNAKFPQQATAFTNVMMVELIYSQRMAELQVAVPEFRSEAGDVEEWIERVERLLKARGELPEDRKVALIESKLDKSAYRVVLDALKGSE